MTEEEEKKRRQAWAKYAKEGGLHVPTTNRWKSAGRGSIGSLGSVRMSELPKIEDVYHVKIGRITKKSMGVAEIERQFVLVPNTRLGEKVTIRITKVPRIKYSIPRPNQFFEAEVIERENSKKKRGIQMEEEARIIRPARSLADALMARKRSS